MNDGKPTGPKPKWWSRPIPGRARDTGTAESPAAAESATYDLAPPAPAPPRPAPPPPAGTVLPAQPPYAAPAQTAPLPSPVPAQWGQYDPWAAAGQQPLTRGGEPVAPKKRRGALLVGAVLLALVAGGIGGGIGAY